MKDWGRSTWLIGIAVLATAMPAHGQVLVRGRVEDATSRDPLAGARVVAPDSSAVFTDSLGVFSIPVRDAASLFLAVTQYGYTSQRFELPPDASSRTTVLLLEPNAVELEAIEVVAESAVARLLTGLANRRNAYFSSVQAFDRERMDRFAMMGSVWDFVNSRTRLSECDPFGDPEVYDPNRLGTGNVMLQDWMQRRSGLCNIDGGGVSVCVDGWDSWAAITELESLDMRSVGLVEIYGRRGRGGIRVYTTPYLLSMASRGRSLFEPVEFGC